MQPQVGVGDVGGRVGRSRSRSVRPRGARRAGRRVPRPARRAPPGRRIVGRSDRDAGCGYQTSSTGARLVDGGDDRSPRRCAARSCGPACRRCGVAAAPVTAVTVPAWPHLDLSQDAAAPHRGARRHRVGERQRAASSPTRSRPRCAPLPHLEVIRTATPSSPGPTSGAPSGWWSPATSTPSRSRTTCRRRLEDGVLHGFGTADMKGGVAVGLRLAAHRARAEPRRDVRVLRLRGGRGRAQRSRPIARDRPDCWPADFAVLMEPTNAAIEGGCQGTHAGRGRHAGIRAHAARGLDGLERDPRGGAGPGPAGGVRAAQPVEIDGLRLPRGPERGRHRRRGGRQRDPGPVRGDGQLPLRAGSRRGRRPRRTCRSSSTGFDVTVIGQRARRAARAGRTRPRRRSWRRSAASRGRSSAGPTCRGSPRSGCRRSTTARATRTSRTSATSTVDVAPILECDARMFAWLGG